MSRKGGYKIIDLKNKPLQKNVGMVYDGIYEKIKNTTKQIVISGLNLDGKEYHDFSINFYLDGTKYTSQEFRLDTQGDVVLEIENTDVVTISF